jgi:hypothetical protein
MRGETEVIVVMEEYNRIAAKGIKGAKIPAEQTSSVTFSGNIVPALP